MTEPVPYRADVTATTAQILHDHANLEDGEETDVVVSIAGRLMLRRDQGKLAFGVLQDSTGRIQLFAMAKLTPEFDGFTGLSIGDWILVKGIVMNTKRGELSVRVDEWTVLAHAQRPFPDKWHGITDPDIRYRQRYVDLWVTEEARTAFRQRSQIVASMRRWLGERDFIEVETPMLHPIPGGALAKPFVTHHNALDTEMYLRIAPELYLKRLVVGGMERVFEIGRVFRNEGTSTRHNPEFTMLELYWAYADHRDMMTLTEDMVAAAATEVIGSTTIEYDGREVDLSTPWRRATMEELILEHAGIEVSIDTPIDELRALCDKFGVEAKDHYGPGKLILEIYEKTTESELWGPIFVTDYPVEVSPLSREHRDRPGYTERFEAIVAGRELCNGFSELQDPVVQRQRFEAQEAEGAAGDDEAMVVDDDYIRALEYGLPGTAGLGIGIDRLVMLLTGTTTIRDVVLFPTLRPESPASAATSTDESVEDDEQSAPE
ncbi:MAG: lysyl-tRNA synthetase class 2 [Candidatus Aldehydirespiratoraceae bacterium]|jgi:lysyl-tRNA synthetase class 2